MGWCGKYVGVVGIFFCDLCDGLGSCYVMRCIDCWYCWKCCWGDIDLFKNVVGVVVVDGVMDIFWVEVMECGKCCFVCVIFCFDCLCVEVVVNCIVNVEIYVGIKCLFLCYVVVYDIWDMYLC